MEYPRAPRRRAEVLFPPNTLKAKVGSGGIDERLIEKAQRIIEETKVDFLPIGKRYLASLEEGVVTTRTSRGQIDSENLIATMLYPAMQLKANGGMFGYPLITSVAARLIRFLEQVHDANEDVLEVVNAFVESLKAILLMGENNRKVIQHGDDLYLALDEACERYFEKHGY
ncbi:MAG: hypothetical protein KGQ41_06415 [Alphaproteobacteria bacterium]|nr:hypothetical protein [Alphaproteobacteria bacterium]